MKEEWRSVRICDISHGVFDGPHATPPISSEGPIYLGIGNITEDGHLDLSDVRHIAEADFPQWTKRATPRGGDIVFTYEATLNRYALIPEGFRGCLGRRTALIRPDTSKVDTRFLFYSFFGRRWRDTIEANRLSGATVDRIPIASFPQFPILLPSLNTQRRVASILGAYDELIDLNRRRIALLEEIARRLFEEWFVRFRFPGYEQHKIIETPDGLLPEAWQIAPLGTMYETSSGGTPSRKHPEYFGGHIPWVKTKELLDGPIFQTEELVTEEGLANSSAKTFPSNTVLVAMYGANIGQLGVLVHPAATNQACCAILPLAGSAAGWAYAYLTLRHSRQRLIALRAGAAQQNISQAVIRGFRILRPSDAVLARFEEIVAPVLFQSFVLHRQNGNLSAQRNLLLPRLVSGQFSSNATKDELEAVA